MSEQRRTAVIKRLRKAIYELEVASKILPDIIECNTLASLKEALRKLETPA